MQWKGLRFGGLGRSTINTQDPNGSSGVQLREFLEPIFGNKYLGVRMRNDPPIKMKEDEIIIFNTDDMDGSGTHWTCCNYYCYFDPFGMPLPIEIKSNYHHLEYRNNTSVQHIKSTSCGYHCVWFLVNKVKKPEDYYRFLFEYPDPLKGSEMNEKYLSKKINSLI